MGEIWNKFKILFKKDIELHHETYDRKEYMSNTKVKPGIILFLKQFHMIEVFDKPGDIKTGLLKYRDVPKNVAFLFRFKDEDIREFHTRGMRFNINIYFYNKFGKLVKKYENCEPHKNYTSVVPCKYVVETKS